MDKWPADKVERRSVSELIPYDRNPRIHPDDQIRQIANSIKQWGWTIPILIDEEGTVIAGHGRLYAAQSLGIEEVPCMTAAGWTEEQKRAYVVADNKIAENGVWDTSLYYSELKEMNKNGFDLSLVGFDGDLSSFEFSPNLEPTVNYSEVTEKDFDRAQSNMDKSLSGISGDKSEGGIEVICPYCAESFKVTGH